MSFPAIIMWLAVVAVAVSFYLGRNPTAAALVASWAIGEYIWLETGNPLPVAYYPFLDIAVLCVIFCKKEWRSLRPYKSTWHQFKSLLLERSPADRVVMLIFPSQWYVYIADIHDYYRWWALFYLTLAQFIAAGYESFYRFGRLQKAVRPDAPPSGAEYRVAWSGGG